MASTEENKNIASADNNKNTDNWFQRLTKGILTSTDEKKDIPKGIWNKCPECGEITTVAELKEHYYVCPKCNHHHRIGSEEYFEILFDDKAYTELFGNLTSKDILGFSDTKSYEKRIKDMQAKTHLKDSMRVGFGTVDGNPLVVACMDFNFIGGSLGSVIGEKISRAVDYAIKKKAGLMIISKSGGARMQESAFSLMQMAKTSGKLNLLSDAKLPYISLLTDPTFGGVTASYAMLGDFNIAEPNALIGFAGPRIIKDTIRKELPKGFQKSEFLLEHGFLDLIVDRKTLRTDIGKLLTLIKN